VDVVESHLRGRGGPQELVEQLEGVSLTFHFCVGLLLTMEFCRRWTKKPKCWSRSCGGWSSSFQNRKSEACQPSYPVHKSQPACHMFQVIMIHQVHVLKCRIVHPTPIQMTSPGNVIPFPWLYVSIRNDPYFYARHQVLVHFMSHSCGRTESLPQVKPSVPSRILHIRSIITPIFTPGLLSPHSLLHLP
jgi:hypothetical protein